MNIKKYIFQLSMIVLFLNSCNNVENENVIIIDNSSVDTSMDISDIIDEISIVALKEVQENHIGNISKLFLSSDKYIVADMYQAKKILVFDKDGHFQKTILKTGGGPNECLQINDCWFTKEGGLEAYDFAQKKIYQYDDSFNLKNIVESSEPYIFHNIMRISNSDNYVGYAAFNTFNRTRNGTPYHVAFLDKDMHITNTCSYFDKKYEGINCLTFANHFYPFKDSLRFGQALDNYIYNISKSGLEKKYKLLYKKNQMPDNMLDKIVGKHLNEFKTIDMNPNDRESYFKDYATFTGNWQENDRYIFISSRQKHEFSFISLVDKQTNKVTNAMFLCEKKRFKLDLPPLTYYDSESNSFIGAVYGEELKKHVYKESKFQKELIDPETFYVVTVKFKK